MIRLEGLSSDAGSFTVGPIDLEVASGEYLVLIGPSGAGKSMLLETVVGLREAASGDVVLDGRSVGGLPPERRRLGYVPQDALLFPHLDVAANIGFGAPRRQRRGAVRDAAARVGAGELLGRRVETLSGGERQRVALARALAAGPEALLVDEPLSALDGPARQELQRLLRQMRASGLTVLHVTHDLVEARDLGTRWAVLVAGRLRQAGAPDEVLGFPADGAVAAFFAAAPSPSI